MLSTRVFLIFLLSALLPLGMAAEPLPSSEWKKAEIVGQPLAGLRVALDIGHYRAKPGAQSARGRFELDFNTATARVIARALEQAGAQLIVINDDGMVTDLARRAELATKAKADCFISVHHDSVNDRYLKQWTYGGAVRHYADNFRGYSVFASSKNPEAAKSREMALRIGEAIYESGLRPTLHHAEAIQGENRPLLDQKTGVYEFTDLVVLKRTTMPAILLECGVIIHRDEELLVQEPAYQELLAHAVVKGLSEAFPHQPKKGLKKLFGGKK